MGGKYKVTYGYWFSRNVFALNKRRAVLKAFFKEGIRYRSNMNNDIVVKRATVRTRKRKTKYKNW